MKNLAHRLEQACAEAVSASAQQGAALARELVPVDSGELRSSIHTRANGLGAAVTAGAGHAVMVEYGTGCMVASPFMLPMAQQMRAPFIRSIRSAVQEVLK